MYSITRYHESLVNLTCFFCLLPFVAPFPIKSDVQYLVFLICILTVSLDVYRGAFRLNRFEIYFLSISLLSFIYISPFNEYDYSIYKRVGLLFSFLVFYVFSRYFFLVKGKWVLAAIYLNFIGVMLQLVSPGIFYSLTNHIVRTIKIQNFDSLRGVSGFAPEPGFLGAMSVVFILVTYLMYLAGKVDIKNMVIVAMISTVMAFLSSSGTASLLFLVMIPLLVLFGHIKLYTKLFVFALAISLLFLYINSDLASGRGVDIAQKIINEPYEVFVEDKSVAMRGIAISVGVESLLAGNIFGHGVGTLSYVADSIIANTALGYLYSDVSGNAGGLLSAFAQYTVEMGMFFIILVLWLYGRVINLRDFYMVRIMTLFFLIATFSILFPPLWLLLAITDVKNKDIYSLENNKY